MNNVRMHVTVLNESGFDQAIYGLSLSHGADARSPQLRATAKRLAFQDGGHNKFLESICVWLDIRCPRYLWQELDTYRIGTTKQSESTMHTLVNRLKELSGEGCYEQYIVNHFEPGSISRVQFEMLVYAAKDDDFLLCKRLLPEGFLQRRVVCTNYKTLRNLILQRRNHKLPHWQELITGVLSQLEHSDFLPGVE